MPSGTPVSGRIGILKDAAGAAACRAAGSASGTRATRAPSRAAPPARRAPTAKDRPTAAPRRSAAAGCDRSRTPSRRRHVRRPSPSRRRQPDAGRRDRRSAGRRKCALPKIAPPTVPGVPAHASSPAQPWMMRPAHQPVDRHRRVGSHAIRARSAAISPPRGRITRPRTPASDTSTFDPPPSIVTGTPAACASRAPSTISSLRPRLDEPVGRTADLERRERRERHASAARDPRRTRRRSASPKSAHADLRTLDGQQRAVPAQSAPPALRPASRRRTRSCRRAPAVRRGRDRP